MDVLGLSEHVYEHIVEMLTMPELHLEAKTRQAEGVAGLLCESPGWSWDKGKGRRCAGYLKNQCGNNAVEH